MLPAGELACMEQFEHTDDEFAPIKAEKVPASHCTHTDDTVAAMTAE